MQKKIGRYFLAGVGFLLPFGIVAIFLRMLFSIVSGVSRPFLYPLFTYFLPVDRISFLINLACAVFTLTIVTVTGFVVSKILGKAVVDQVDGLFQKLPGIGELYFAVKKLLRMIMGDEDITKKFRSVVLVEWPSPGNYAMGLVTAETFRAAKTDTGKDLMAIFIPTPPNPINGFLVMLPRERVTPLNIRVDEAIRILFSIGLAA